MTSRVVHVRCGSDIRAKLQQAGLDGRFVEFSDPVCDGPVPALDRAAYIDTRTGHLAPAYGLAPNLVRRKLEDEYQAIDDISQDEHAPSSGVNTIPMTSSPLLACWQLPVASSRRDWN
ncbi:MAG: hypothetical protein R3D03_11270 [Geminicoccaceae bacterium]